MAHWSGIGIPKTNAIALEVSYTHTHGDSEEEEEVAQAAPVSTEKQEEKPPEQTDQKLLVKAMMKAKMSFGVEQWNTLDGDEKKRLTQIELAKLASK